MHITLNYIQNAIETTFMYRELNRFLLSLMLDGTAETMSSVADEFKSLSHDWLALVSSQN